jgi:hypothetical protein
MNILRDEVTELQKNMLAKVYDVNSTAWLFNDPSYQGSALCALKYYWPYSYV